MKVYFPHGLLEHPVIASVHNRSKMYRTSAAVEIHATVHLVKTIECTLYAL